jgi:hypothetical protein
MSSSELALIKEQVPDADWDKLSVEARSAVCLLAGLREGRVIEEFAERLTTIVDAVIAHTDVSEEGKISGPKGTITLTLTVAPLDDRGSTITVVDKITSKHPEDRDHPVYVGKRSTLHTRQSTEDALFAVQVDGGAAEIEYPPDRAAGPDK